MVTIKKISSGEYFLNKRVNEPFIFHVRAKGSSDFGSVSITKTISCPKELVGKNIMLKVIVL